MNMPNQTTAIMSDSSSASLATALAPARASNNTVASRRTTFSGFMNNIMTSWNHSSTTAITNSSSPFATAVMPGANKQPNEDDLQEELLSTSSLSSPISSISPTTPTSTPLPSSRLSSPMQRSISTSNLWAASPSATKASGLAAKSLEPKADLPQLRTSPALANDIVRKDVRVSPPPSKRSRSNTVHVHGSCLKSFTALQNIMIENTTSASSATSSESSKELMTPKKAHTPRKMASNLSLRGALPAFTFGGNGSGSKRGQEGLASPKSPRSPLGQLAYPPQADTISACSTPSTPSLTPSPRSPKSQCTTLSPPYTRSVSYQGDFPSLNPKTVGQSAVAAAEAGSTLLLPQHMIYIDKIAVSYNPSSPSGQECKKLLMRLERYKKRSSVDLSALAATAQQPSHHQAHLQDRRSQTADRQTGNGEEGDTSSTATANQRKSDSTPVSTPVSAQISRCNSAGSTPTSNSHTPVPPAAAIAATLGHLNHGCACGNGNSGQTFKVIAKIREQDEGNKIEVSGIPAL